MTLASTLCLFALAGASTAAGAHAARTWEKVLLSDAVAKGAVCLDGSPGGYYISRKAADKWIVFHQGGGWCSSDANCAGRALTDLGSSKAWGPTYTDVYEGSQLFDTAPFDDYTVVYAMYCDGGSWTGNAPPVSAKPSAARPNMTIYYRGRLLLDAMLDRLLADGLGAAKSLLYAGCSAGGLTAYLHADYVAQRMPAGVQTLALADAMFALHSNSYTGESLFPARMQWGYTAWNSSASVNQACLASHPGAAGYECMFGATAAGFVQTPLFVLNSKYDTWQEKAIIGANSSVILAPAAVKKFWVEYGHKMVSKLRGLPSRHGAFVTNCAAHCQSGAQAAWHAGMESAWVNRTIEGVSIQAAVVAWYAAAQKREYSAGNKHVEACDVKACGTDRCS